MLVMNALLFPTGDGGDCAKQDDGHCANHDGGLCAKLARIQETVGDAAKEGF
jgi:hypothetical protein